MTTSRLPRIAVSSALPARRALAALALASALLHGCTDDSRIATPVDSCNDGVTFSEIDLVNAIETIGGKDAVRIVWSLGPGRAQELPADYFAAVQVVEGADTATLTDENELTVVLGDIEVPPPSSSLRFSLRFPDRRDYIGCTHPASPDAYTLEVDLHFDAASELTLVEFTEEFQPGPY
jgi:hypothetical protein